jgi:hypothetical protein
MRLTYQLRDLSQVFKLIMVNKCLSAQLISTMPFYRLPRCEEFYTKPFGKAAKMNQVILEHVQLQLASKSEYFAGVDEERKQVGILRASKSAFFIGLVSCMCGGGECQRAPFSFVVIHPSLASVFPRVVSPGPNCQLTEVQEQVQNSMSLEDQQILHQWSQHNAAESNKQRSHARVKAGHIACKSSNNSASALSAGSTSDKVVSLSVNENLTRKRKGEKQEPAQEPSVVQCNSISVVTAIDCESQPADSTKVAVTDLAPRVDVQVGQQLVKSVVQSSRLYTAPPYISQIAKLVENELNRPLRLQQLEVRSDAAVPLPLWIQCSFTHAEYGPVCVTALLVYMECCEADGVQIRPGRYEQKIRHPRFSLQFNALCAHIICSVEPAGTPLDLFQNQWFYSLHTSVHKLGHNASGWQGWTALGYPKLTVGHVAATLGFIQHPSLDTNLTIIFNDVKAYEEDTRDHVESCPMRDVLASYCNLECDEVRCRPQDESSATYYKCPHGVEYARDECRRTDGAFFCSDDGADAAHSAGVGVSERKRAKKAHAKAAKQNVTSSDSKWANRIRFVTVEGQRNYVDRLNKTRADTQTKLKRLAPSWDYWNLVMIVSTILLEEADQDRMRTYWEPVSKCLNTDFRAQLKIDGITHLRWASASWTLKSRYRLANSYSSNLNHNNFAIRKWVPRSCACSICAAAVPPGKDPVASC